MGLLDEAIREHLELKRKRGADPTALAHQEQEALGPAVRETAVAEAPVEGTELAPEAEAAAAEPLPAAPAEQPEPEPPASEPEPAGQETVAFDVDDVFADEEPEQQDEGEKKAESEEDVLEETPEFLQETPEHDRLWFEQKPPRDFDFDG
jgi:hypothetical protein